MSVVWFESEQARKLQLILKIELVAFSSGQVVQPVSHAPNEGQRLGQRLKLIMRQMTQKLQISWLVDMVFGSGHPQHGVIIPQAAHTFF